MAMHDWNHDGKKDMVDNFIEYQIYKDVTGQKDEPSYTPSRGNDMSTFGAIVSVIAGLLLQSALYVTLGIDVDDVPVLVVRRRIEIGTNCILNSRLLPIRLCSHTGNCIVQEEKLQLLVALFQ